MGGDEAATEINGSLVFKTVLASINLVLKVVALVLIFILLSKQLSLVSHNVSTIEVRTHRVPPPVSLPNHIQSFQT